MRNTFYDAPHKRAQGDARQAGNDPMKDGFTRSRMVHHQPSEMSDAPSSSDGMIWPDPDWEKRMENEDIEETR